MLIKTLISCKQWIPLAHVQKILIKITSHNLHKDCPGWQRHASISRSKSVRINLLYDTRNLSGIHTKKDFNPSRTFCWVNKLITGNPLSKVPTSSKAAQIMFGEWERSVPGNNTGFLDPDEDTADYTHPPWPAMAAVTSQHARLEL